MFQEWLNKYNENINKGENMCSYCEKEKRIEEINTDQIYLEIYGKHLRLQGKVMGIRFGRDFMINYCPMCGKKLGG